MGSTVIAALVGLLAAGQGRPNFSGTWDLLYWTKCWGTSYLVVEQTDARVNLTWTGQPTTSYRLDGTEETSADRGRSVTTRATWAGSRLILFTTTTGADGRTRAESWLWHVDAAGRLVDNGPATTLDGRPVRLERFFARIER